MPELLELVLWFDMMDLPTHLVWNCAVFRDLCNTRLPKLKKLTLTNAVIHPSDLTRWLLVNCDNLEHLALRRIRLRREVVEYGSSGWPGLFQKLRRTNDRLKHIALSCLYTISGDLLVFSSHGFATCKICRPRKRHHASEYYELDFEHVTYWNDGGVWPGIVETAAINWHEATLL